MKQSITAFKWLVGTIAAAVFISCANIGNPSGGPRDEDAPRFVRANPPQGSTDVDLQKIDIEFNELINVKDASQKVVISPTSAQQPRVSSQGRKVTIRFVDSLQANTTYTVDFANSIEDITEGNKIPSFTYSFSTGPEIDTLRISGMVLNAENLEPQQGMLVGVHSLKSDTAFTKLRLERVAKTDDRGRFTIRGLKEGSYRVFALGDLNSDYRWDNPDESIAFYDFDVVPSTEQVMVTDTIYNLLTGAVDSTFSRRATRYLPNDILLSSFKIDYAQQYLKSTSRQDSTRLLFQFNAPSKELPQISLVDYPDLKDWYSLERTAGNDTLTYWITNPNLLTADTLIVAASFLNTNKERVLEMKNDTLKFITRHAPAPKKSSKKKKNEETTEATRNLQLTVSGGQHEYYQPLFFEFDNPVATLKPGAIRLEIKPDSVWLPVNDVNIEFIDSTLNRRKFKIDRDWEFGANYRLVADTLAATDIYGGVSAPKEVEFNIKNKEDYASLTFEISGLGDAPAFVQILNSGDGVVMQEKVVDGKAVFPYLSPTTYYARLIEDINENGKWDTGSYDELRQPESVFYYPKKITLKKNWEIDYVWDVTLLAIDTQKPDAIKKNKPEADKRARTKRVEETEDEEDEIFDPTANPFDPNQKRERQRRNATGHGSAPNRLGV